MGKESSDANSPQPKAGNGINHKAVFIAAVADMTWRLALVVIIPIVGGFKLDQHFGWSPALTITGFVVAAVGMFLVTWQAVNKADQRLKPKEDKK